MANGLTVDQIRELCRANNLPDTKGGYTDKAQVDTLGQLVEDEIAAIYAQQEAA
jgi:hypothetical protein